MDDKNKLIGKGRGAFLLEMMKHREQTERFQTERLSHSLETPSVSSSDQTRSSDSHISSHLQSSIGSNNSASRGRGHLTSLVKSMSSTDSEFRDSSVSSKTLGRGYLLDLVQRRASSQSIPQAGISVQKDDSGVLGKLADLSVYDAPSISDVTSSKDTVPICRQGTSGTKIVMAANYIDLKLNPGKGLFQYEVKFAPDIDSTGLRRKLLNQHAVKLGRTRTFDGMTLFLPTRLPENMSYYYSEHPMDGSQVTLTIIYKKQQSMSENIQFFNVLFARIMRALELIRIGRQNYNPSCARIIEQHRLEVWPGYVTAINEYEGGLKLCLDSRHRVLRTETVRDLITEIHRRHSANFHDVVVKEIVGTSVLTRYNNKTYRIDDIAWDKTPQFVFSRNGEDISLINYYRKQWNIDIQDETQPLLVHRATDRTSTGEKQERIILLVPELSYAAGLTDNIRSNYRIMRDLDTVTKMSPNVRRDVIREFVEKIQKNDVAREILSEWGLYLSNDLVQFSGRLLGPEEIYFGNNKTYKLERSSDWSNAAVKNYVLRTPNLNNWYILYVKKDTSCVEGFLKLLQGVVRTIGMRVNQPEMISLKDDRTDTYTREILKCLRSESLELIVVIFPTNRTDRYTAVKNITNVIRNV